MVRRQFKDTFDNNHVLTTSQETLPGDEVGEMFSQQLNTPTRGAAARQDMLSPLNEMSPEQILTYTAPQLARILRQHEDAVNNAITDRHGGFLPLGNEKPYVVPQREECKTTLCPGCGRGGMAEEQSYLSIGGVLNNDFPPTASVGYGFRPLGGRPIADANIVRNLGLRDPTKVLLPDQAQRIKNDENAKAKSRIISDDGQNAEAVEVASPQKVEMATKAGEKDQSGSTPESAKTEADIKATNSSPADKVEDNATAFEHAETKVIAKLTGSLKIGSKGGSVNANVTNMDSSAAFEGEDSNYDVVQLYVDSDEDTLGNNTNNDEDSTSIKDAKPVKVAEDTKDWTR